MTFPAPKIDDRRFQDLVREALDRIPAHTPEWTHLGESDPGVTMVELFAFMAESVLYRANRVPDAARSKFLDLLGIKLSPARPARGIATFDPGNRTESVRLDAGMELRAGAVPFRTAAAIDVVPVAALAMVKEKATLSDAQTAYYDSLYRSLKRKTPNLVTYRTRILDGGTPVDLGSQTVDGRLWIALLLPKAPSAQGRDEARKRVWRDLAGRYLSLGLAPHLADRPRSLGATRGAGTMDDPTPVAKVETPFATSENGKAVAGWRSRPFRGGTSLHQGPDVLEIQLPAAASDLDISPWDDIDPLESGVGEFPPALDDSRLADRVVGWLRIEPSTSSDFSILWAGVNACWIEQRKIVENEVLGTGDGGPDQEFRLQHPGVVASTVEVRVVPSDSGQAWTEIDDLAAAGPEVRWTDPASPPGSGSVDHRPVDVFAVDAAAGTVRFGDGLRGRRPAAGTKVIARYHTCTGSQGNLPKDSIKSGPDLPVDIKPTNPIATWGGSDRESVETGSRRVSSWMRHRDRLVTAEDFAEIARSTPGVDLARIDVVPAWHPDLATSLPGDVPGTVTLMVVPRADAANPGRPTPDATMLEAICRHLDPRRLVTTEIVVQGPKYVGIRLSLGITVAGGFSAPDVRDRLERRLRRYLSPVREAATADGGPKVMESGWPLRKEVNALEILVEAAREDGVLRIDQLLLGSLDSAKHQDGIRLEGLELPWISAISVMVGPALPLSMLDGKTAPEVETESGGVVSRQVPVPVVAETC